MRTVIAAIVSWLVVGSALTVRVSAQPGDLEYEVKAAFLLNFSRYVTWPAEKMTPPFRICVYGSNPFGRHLRDAVSGEHWQNGRMEVHEIQTLMEGRACHVLYVPAAAGDVLADHWPNGTMPVLTVGENERFLMQGGMIRLFLDNNKVRFSINLTAAETAQLQISSRLLRLAREVIAPTAGDR
jgi:hypothetical protein